MKTKLMKRSQGFTIIEVLIVLAIAGLILAIVFFAVPQLQRNQRDNQRQSTATRLKAELETFAGNNQGDYPFAAVTPSWIKCNTQAASGKNCGSWYSTYLSSGKVKITDPSLGQDATICYSNSTTAIGTTTSGAVGACSGNWTTGTVWVAVGDKCNGSNIQAGTTAGSANSKQYAVVAALDRQGTLFCVDNG